MLIHFMGN